MEDALSKEKAVRWEFAGRLLLFHRGRKRE